MNTLTKCQFIEDLSRICVEEKVYSDFVTINDLGISLAISVVAEIADLKGRGQEIIDETYSHMCELLEVDPSVEYSDFDDFMSRSNYEKRDDESDN
jgi:hypothetical protein